MIPFACEHPIRVTLPDGRKEFVPCGKCCACLNIKGSERSNLLVKCLAFFKCCYLVTLTYDNDNLPLAKLSDDLRLVHPYDVDYNGCFKQVDFIELSSQEKDFYFHCESLFGGLPVVSHDEMTRFKKRFRYYIEQNGYEEECFIYTCAEYGPSTFRPHYHLIFGFKSNLGKDCVEKSISQAWISGHGNSLSEHKPKGFVNVQRITSQRGSSSYVAKYCNSVSELPTLLQRSAFRTFVQHQSLNKFLFSNGVFDDEKFVRSAEPTYVEPFNENSEFVIAKCSDYLKNRFFPKYSGFSRVISACRIRFAKEICGFSNKQGFIDHFVSLYRVKFRSKLSDFENLIFGLYYDSIVSLFSFKNKLSKFYDVCNRIINLCRRFRLSIEEYSRLHAKFYSSLALLRLKEFYTLQSDLLKKGVSVNDLCLLYVNTDDSFELSGQRPSFITLNDLPVQRSFIWLSHSIFQNSIKTKHRNDHLVSLGKSKKPWILSLSRSKFSFIKNFYLI